MGTDFHERRTEKGISVQHSKLETKKPLGPMHKVQINTITLPDRSTVSVRW